MKYAHSYGYFNRKGDGDMGTERNLCKEEKRELRALADGFGLLYREDIQEIIETCKSYSQGQRAIMQVYTKVYMK